MRRATRLSPPDFLLLDQWGRQLREAFDEPEPDAGPFLVGSAMSRGDYRDVDVRMATRAPWLVGDHPEHSLDAIHVVRLRTINLAVSLWGRQVTSLPIDFQFQPADEFHTYDGHTRNPLGIRTLYEGKAATESAYIDACAWREEKAASESQQ